MAEALLKRELPHHQIGSAGLDAVIGSPADPLAVEVCAAHGLDISSHRGRQLGSWMLSQAELILVMDRHQKLRLEKPHLLSRGKVFLLGKDQAVIGDPYGLQRSDFETAFQSIQAGVTVWADRIQRIGPLKRSTTKRYS